MRNFTKLIVLVVLCFLLTMMLISCQSLTNRNETTSTEIQELEPIYDVWVYSSNPNITKKEISVVESYTSDIPGSDIEPIANIAIKQTKENIEYILLCKTSTTDSDKSYKIFFFKQDKASNKIEIVQKLSLYNSIYSSFMFFPKFVSPEDLRIDQELEKRLEGLYDKETIEVIGLIEKEEHDVANITNYTFLCRHTNEENKFSFLFTSEQDNVKMHGVYTLYFVDEQK